MRLLGARRFSVWENLDVIIRPATPADAVAIASLLNAFLATTTIEWTDTPQTADRIPEWLDQHETVRSPKSEVRSLALRRSGRSATS
jgi:hypothetical protein